MKAFAAILFMLAATVNGAAISGPEVHILRRHYSTVRVQRVMKDSNDLRIPFGNDNEELINIPSVMLNQYYFPVHEVTPRGSVLKLRCNENSDHIGCDFFVNVYHCPGCSGPVNGGLASALTAQGHQGGSCAPGFIVPDVFEKFVQPMVAFRIRVEAGEHVLLPELENDAKYIAIFGAQEEDVCKHRGPHHCEEPNVCTSDDGKCVRVHFCPKTSNPRPQGPDARMCPRHCLPAPRWINFDVIA